MYSYPGSNKLAKEQALKDIDTDTQVQRKLEGACVYCGHKNGKHSMTCVEIAHYSHMYGASNTDTDMDRAFKIMSNSVCKECGADDGKHKLSCTQRYKQLQLPL